MARASCSRAVSGEASASSTSSTVGADTAATTSSASRTSAGSRAIRCAISSLRLPGTGSGSPAASGSLRSASARASSSAKKGFPPDVRCSWRSVGRRKDVPRRARRSRSSERSSSDPTATRSILSGGSERRNSEGSTSVSPRTVVMTATGSASSRRSAKWRTCADETSSHWRSSMAIRTACSRASARLASSTASDTAR